MNTQEVANRLVELCREGKNLDAIDELYADNVVSLEPKGSHMEFSEGKENAVTKNQQWYDMVEEIHSGVVSDPLVSGDFFSITMDMDVSYKGQGRMMMNEVCVYGVKDGKIVSEQFFYSLPGM